MQTAAVAPAEPAEALRAAKHAYARFAAEEPVLYEMMFGLGGVRVAPESTWHEGALIARSRNRAAYSTG